MVENRIITENKRNFDEKGFLNYEYLKDYFKNGRDVHWGEFEGEYGKYIISETNNKRFIDTEMITSQVFNKLGIKTPVPFVVLKNENGNKRYFLVKNSLSTDRISYLNSRNGHFGDMIKVNENELKNNTILATNYHQFMEGQIANELLNANKFNNKILDHFRNIKLSNMLSEEKKGVFSSLDPLFSSKRGMERNPILDYFYVGSVKKRIKMNILDMAILNSTRTPADYLYKLDNYGLVSDVMSLSSGSSFANVSSIINRKFNEVDYKYFNNYSNKRESFKNIFKNLRTNKESKRYLDLEDLTLFGNDIEKVCESEIAQDIEETTNYRVSDSVYEVLVDNLNNMTEELENIY